MVSKLPRLTVQIIECEVVERVPGQHAAWNPRGTGRHGRHGRRLRHLRSNLDERIGAHLGIVFDNSFRPKNHGTWRSLRYRAWRGRRRPEYSRRRSQLGALALAAGPIDIGIIARNIARRP